MRYTLSVYSTALELGLAWLLGSRGIEANSSIDNYNCLNMNQRCRDHFLQDIKSACDIRCHYPMAASEPSSLSTSALDLKGPWDWVESD